MDTVSLTVNYELLCADCVPPSVGSEFIVFTFYRVLLVNIWCTLFAKTMSEPSVRRPEGLERSGQLKGTSIIQRLLWG